MLASGKACVRASPSDHFENFQLAPAALCMSAAETVFSEPTITRRAKGVACAVEPTTSSSPDGSVSNTRLTVCGSSARRALRF